MNFLSKNDSVRKSLTKFTLALRRASKSFDATPTFSLISEVFSSVFALKKTVRIINLVHMEDEHQSTATSAPLERSTDAMEDKTNGVEEVLDATNQERPEKQTSESRSQILAKDRQSWCDIVISSHMVPTAAYWLRGQPYLPGAS